MISTYMDFGTVTTSERASIMTIMNANNFSTNHCVTQIDGVMHLEAKCSYICLTTFVTRKQYMLFLNGASVQDRIERFKFYGKKYAKLPPCMPPEQIDENVDSQEEVKPKVLDKPWSVTLQPSKQIWKEANFNIYGFIHYIHYQLPCTEIPQLCRYYANNSTNNCNFT